MATSSERLGVVDEKDEFGGQAGSEIDWRCWREPDFVFDLASPLQRTNQTRRLPANDFPMSSLVIQSEVPDASEDVVPHCDTPKAHKALNLSCVKGVIFREKEDRENALLKALIKIGHLDQARAKIKWMTGKDMNVTRDNFEMLNNATGVHDWRSPWAPFKRPIVRMETRRALIKELKDGNTKMDEVRAADKQAAELQAKWKADRETLRKQMKDFTMWQIYLIVPWKEAKVVLDVDTDFTLLRVKKMIHESEGVNSDQQKLWLIRRVVQRRSKSPAARAAEQAAVARFEKLLKTSAMGMIRQAGLAEKKDKKSKKLKSQPNLNLAGLLQASASVKAYDSEVKPPKGLSRFNSQSPLASTQRDTPSPFTQNNPFHTGPDSKIQWGGNMSRGSPMRTPKTKWDALDHIKSTKKQWAALAASHMMGSPRVLAVPKRQTSLKRIAVNPAEYQDTTQVKVELEGDDMLLTSFDIRAGDTLEVGIDEHATKIKQRQALLKELGELTGDDVEQRVIDAFHRFDIDNSGSIERRELGLSMMSLGIYLTDHELDALTRQFDDDGNGEFDLPDRKSVV